VRLTVLHIIWLPSVGSPGVLGLRLWLWNVGYRKAARYKECILHEALASGNFMRAKTLADSGEVAGVIVRLSHLMTDDRRAAGIGSSQPVVAV
jgi:hypothetical protein